MAARGILIPESGFRGADYVLAGKQGVKFPTELTRVPFFSEKGIIVTNYGTACSVIAIA